MLWRLQLNKMLVFVLFSIFTVCVFFNEPIHAQSIPDGGEMWSEGYRPYTDANDVHDNVKNMWNNGKYKPDSKNGKLTLVRGGKNPFKYSESRGEKLIYDIYSGATNQSKKRSWRVVNSGGKPYFTFDGWSVNFGYHHHAKKNQATYIGLINKNNPTEKRIYKTRMLGNTSANPDLRDASLKTCGKNAFKKKADKNLSSSCNMDYQYTQFRAYIPLEDLFQGQSYDKEWEMYLIKRVENQVVYDELILPYETKSYQWGSQGKVTMQSGVDSDKLTMTVDNAIKRKSPRGGGNGWTLGYFVPGKTYTTTGFNESEGVANWYRVKDDQKGVGSYKPPLYKPTFQNRWTASTYWDFNGTIATLSLEKTHAHLRIQHIDATTQNLLKEEKEVVRANKKYSFYPKKNGYFKDKDGNPYIATPEGQMFNEVVKHDQTIRFYYKADLPDPSKDVEMPKTTDGKVDGKAFWELRRLKDNQPSQLYAEMNFTPSGKHYAIRNMKHSLVLPDYEKEEKEDPIALLADAKSVKDKTLKYNFAYEYTNTYRKNYKCVEKQGSHCFKWEFDKYTPVWDKGKVFKLSETFQGEKEAVSIKLDHRYGETIKKDAVEDIIKEAPIIGRSDSFADNKRKSEVYRERFKKLTDRMKAKNKLKTQTALPVTPDRLEYTLELPSNEHEKKNFNVLQKGLINGHYFPVDIDKSLQEDFTNHTKYESLGDYAFFLQQDEMQDKGVRAGKRSYEIDFISDYFFVAKHTGFISGYPVAYQLNRHLLYGEDKPTDDKVIPLAIKKLEQDYLRQTKHAYRDDILYLNGNKVSDKQKLQRYYIPISPESKLKPNKIYTNKIVLENVGLSDITWQYGQQFSFEHYLFGSGHDEAWFIEQPDPRVRNFKSSDVNTITIKHEDKQKIVELMKERPDERLHRFRLVDRDFVDKVKKVIEGF